MRLLFISIIAFAGCNLYAQEPNPFKSIGKKADVLDISKGKYTEIIEKDSLERIGSVIINRHTRKIEKFIDETSLKKQLADNTRQSRFLSVDPLTSKFAELTPYQYASNSPISGTDLDGAEFRYFGLDWTNRTSTKLKLGKINKADNDIAFQLVFRVGNIDGGSIVEIPVTINRGVVGLNGSFVNYNGKSVQIPDDYINDLPPQTDPIWETFTSDDEIDENFLGAVNLIVSTVQNLDALRGIIGQGGFANFLKKNGLDEKVANIKSLRQKAVRDAWKEGTTLIEATGQGTRRWTKKEIAELKKTGKVKGYEGHHINSVNGSPELAGEANNIEFVKGRKEHIQKHDGNFRNPTKGELIDRTKLIDEYKKQQSGGN
jgi:hypothetical protein